MTAESKEHWNGDWKKGTITPIFKKGRQEPGHY